MVIRCVTGRRHSDQFDTLGEGYMFAVGDRPMGRCEMRRGWRDERCTRPLGQGRAAGHIVGVRMGVQCPCQSEVEPFDECIVGHRESRWVDDSGGAITEIDHVRRMPETLIDEVVDLHRQRLTMGLRPATRM